MDVGGRDLNAPDQPCFLIGCNVGLVAVHGFAPAMAGPAGLAIVADAGGRDQGGIDQRALRTTTPR